MSVERIWIYYQPRIYSDLFKQIILSFGTVEILGEPSIEQLKHPTLENQMKEIDLIIMSIDTRHELETNLNYDYLADAWMIAFPPHGEYGLRRKPHCGEWEEIRPFGLQQFIDQVRLMCDKL